MTGMARFVVYIQKIEEYVIDRQSSPTWGFPPLSFLFLIKA